MTDPDPDPDADDDSDGDGARSIEELYDALQELGHPVATAEEVARALECTHEEADRWLSELAETGSVGRRNVERDPVVWYPVDWERRVSREHVIAFPDRRELVVEHPDQFTRARLSQFAYLVDTSGSGGYLYRIREEDVWGAPYDDLGDLLASMRAVLGERHPGLEEWVERQWKRARQFVLRTHEDGYVVLEADSASLMGNVARQVLDEEHLHAPISDTESWVVEGSEGAIKRLLYDEGYPVRDERDLDTGDPLEIDLDLELRDYQREWVDRFAERKAGVLVGPPGSGKTVAGMGAMAAVGGETLILVPSRELAAQWHQSLLANTSLGESEIGEYHGGEKAVRPVTIATYQIAGMDRHRRLFDERRWGLILYDECLSGDTVVETPDGKTTFEALDRTCEFGEGWNTDVDLTVRTYDLEQETYTWDSVTGVYKTSAPVQRITTNTGRDLKATEGHTHLVFDPETCEIREQQGINEGDYLVQPLLEPDARTGAAAARKRYDITLERLATAMDVPPSTANRQFGSKTAASYGAVTEIVASRQERALEYVRQLKKLTNVNVLRVDTVEEIGRETVYDFETESHTFLANGLLTHNCHHIPSPIHRRSADLQSKHRLGLSATPIRESDDEAEIFTLIGPPIGTDWSSLFDAGFVVEPEVEIRYVPWESEEAEGEYASATGHERRQTAASNPAKLPEIRRLLEEHSEEKTLIFVDWLEQGREYEEALDVPFLSGETRYARRERLLSEFRHGARDTLIVSRVGDEGIDLPDASLAIVASGLGGSRRQGAQRAGRTMRPVGGARMYVLATRGTEEEEFARRQVRHLQSKGIHVMEADVDPEADGDGVGEAEPE